jgi:hypothetical protein
MVPLLHQTGKLNVATDQGGLVRTTLSAVLAMFVFGPAFAGTGCKFAAQRSAREAVQGITRLVLVAQAGELRVLGARGAQHIEAAGEACAPSQRLLDKVTISSRREGSTLYVEATTPSDASLDLSIIVPDTIALDVQDSSGDATFEDLRSLKLIDGSGNVRIRRIADAVDLTDGSGNISVDQVGSISLSDGSGDIILDRVGGNAEVVVDGSGDIYVRDVSGSVHVLQDGSGEIDMVQVKGNATVGNDGSGRIYAGRIGGEFAVLSDSSGGVSYREVRGKVSIPGFTSALADASVD